MTVRYEDLVLCYHETVQAILGFLSLQHVPEMDDYPMNAKVVSDNAWFEPARAISAGSVGRWRNPMQRERVDCLLAEPGACRLLSRLNYGMGGG